MTPSSRGSAGTQSADGRSSSGGRRGIGLETARPLPCFPRASRVRALRQSGRQQTTGLECWEDHRQAARWKALQMYTDHDMYLSTCQIISSPALYKHIHQSSIETAEVIPILVAVSTKIACVLSSPTFSNLERNK